MSPHDYTHGAGGALTGAESALSSLPLCPCGYYAEAGPQERTYFATPCYRFAHRVPGHSHDLECSAGHVYRGTPEELADAEGAERAAARRRGGVGVGPVVGELDEWEEEER